MDNITTITALVQEILTNEPNSRNSDNLLFYLICKKLLLEQGKDIDTIEFGRLFLSLKAYGLPKFETVGRCRRRLQQEFPCYRCSDEVAMVKSLKEEEFRQFVTEGLV